MCENPEPLTVGTWVQAVTHPHYHGPIVETDHDNGIFLVFWPWDGYAGWYPEENLVPAPPTPEEEAEWLITQLSR